MQAPDHLTEAQRTLWHAAAAAAEAAYVPYSQFPVGAALRTNDGTVFTGCNIENASYGLTICAERAAVFAAVSAGHTSFEAVAVYVASADGQPCGACRQVLAEFAPHAEVIYRRAGEVVRATVGELLPNSFEPGALPRA